MGKEADDKSLSEAEVVRIVREQIEHTVHSCVEHRLMISESRFTAIVHNELRTLDDILRGKSGEPGLIAVIQLLSARETDNTDRIARLESRRETDHHLVLTSLGSALLTLAGIIVTHVMSVLTTVK